MRETVIIIIIIIIIFIEGAQLAKAVFSGALIMTNRCFWKRAFQFFFERCSSKSYSKGLSKHLLNFSPLERCFLFSKGEVNYQIDSGDARFYFCHLVLINAFKTNQQETASSLLL